MRNKILCASLLFFSASLISAAQAPHPNANLSRLQNAAREMAAGKLDQAEIELQSVLRSTPQEYHALDLMGVIRVLQKRGPEGEKYFRQAIQAKPDFAPASAHLGVLYLQMQRPDEALPYLREAVRLDPVRTDVPAALAHIFLNQAQAAASARDPKKSLILLADARKYAPGNADVQFAFGTMALQLSKWQEAAEALQQTLQLRPNDAIARYNLGRALMNLGKFEDARQQFAQYVAERSDDASGYCSLGMTLAALEHSDEARVQFEKSITLAPAQTESYFRLGLLNLEAKDFDAADKNLHHVLDVNPKHAGALSAMGRLEFWRKHYSEALAFLQQSIVIDASTREPHYYLGLTFARMGRKQESDEQLAIATRLEHEEAEQRRMEFTTGDAHGTQP